jgi:putative transposase
MEKTIPLEPGIYYHIYNRGINGEYIFREERNYVHFLRLYTHHVEPIADTFAYCLLRNHFHLLVRIRETFEVSGQSEVGTTLKVSPDDQTLEVGRTFGSPETSKVYRQFSNFFNAYAKAINKAYQRTGSLFEHRFGRIPITSDRYFMQLVHYIHFNPQKHGFVADFREWPYSSYRTLLSDKPTQLKRDYVLGWFDGRARFIEMHQALADEREIKDLISDDDNETFEVWKTSKV